MTDTLDTAGAVASYLNPQSPPTDFGSTAELGAQARYSMANVVGGQPDYEAELRSVVKRTGVPVDTVRAYPDELKKQATLGAYDFDQLAVEFPNTTKFLADQDNAAVGHADTGTLTALESAAQFFIKPARAIASAAPQASGGLYGAAAAPFELLGIDSVGGFLREQQKNAQGLAKSVMGLDADAGFIEKSVLSGFQSAGQNLMMLPLGLANTGRISSEAAVLGLMGVITGGQSYGKGRDAGLAPAKALAFGIQDATAEVVTEKYLGMAGFLKNVKAGASAAKLFSYELFKEIPGEIGATLWQNFNEWANVNPDKPVGDFIAEQPEAIAQTIIATLVGGTTQIGAVKALEKITTGGQQRAAAAQQAEQHAQVLETMQTTMQASTILQHSPETLTAYAQSLVEDGAPNVYVDSTKLVEAGIDLQALAQLVPSIAAQLDQVQSGGDLVIPTAELLAGTIGSEFSQPLIDNARTDVNGMSRAEATAYMAEQGDQVNAEIDRVLAEKENDAEFKAGRDQVQAQIVTQLNEVKRFTPKVNEHYATLAANFYAVMAARTGMTVQQFADTYKLGFSGQTTADGMYDQGGGLADVRQQWADMGIDNYISEKNGVIDLSQIIVQKAERGKGVGTKAMQAIIEYADRTGQRIELTPDTSFGASSVSRLTKFYKQFGFKENKGRSKDFTTRAAMIRESRGTVLHQFAGAAAQTADVHALETAERRLKNGVRHEFVLRDTGWFRGVDGKMRFEISDKDAKLKPAIKSLGTGGYEAKPIKSVTYKKNADGTYDLALNPPNPQKTTDFVHLLGVSESVLDAVLPESVRDSVLRSEGENDYIGNFEDAKRIQGDFQFEGFNALPLEEVIDHPALFAAYSALKTVMLQVDPAMGNGGAFIIRDDDQRVVRIGKGSQLSTLLHEIQHGIQDIEGFATGGSPNGDQKAYAQQLSSDLSNLIAEDPRLEAAYRAWETSQNAMEQAFTTGQEFEEAAVQRDEDALLALPKGQKALDLYFSLAGLEGDASASSVMSDRYKRLAGEVEARNTQTRAGFTDEERRLMPAYTTADVKDSDVIVQFNGKDMKSAPTPANAQAPAARGQISFGNDITQQASIISMMKGADLSTFIHEGGHFFLEVQADLAARIAGRIANGEQVSDGERSIVDDFNTTLDWMGVKGSPEFSAIQTWYLMTPDEKRQHHEQWARGFEAYAFEGKSPSLELTKMFQTFRAWLVNVYRAMLKSVNASKTDIADTMKVELTDEVRAVMDRMLATSEQIQEAEAARAMGPLFQSADEAGMDLDAYKLYHDMGTQATMDAMDELQGKGLRDMQWLNNARSRKLKELQKQHDALRAQITREVRREVMAQPLYRAWTFLTARDGDKVVGDKPVGKSTSINPEVDNLFEAIAKLGGLDRAALKSQWGHPENEKIESGVFGQPVARKTDGYSIDAMAERLLEYGYLLPDENGKADLDKFEALFDDQLRGVDRYSISRDMAAAYGDAPLDVPDLPDFGAGKLRTEDLRTMYGTQDDAVWRKLSKLRMTSDTTGLHPEVVAGMFTNEDGTPAFSSADELVQALASAEAPRLVIEGRTDQRMLEEHGDLATPAGLERAADMAIHNDARVRFVATELCALQHAMSVREKVPGRKHTVDVLVQAAKEHASAVIASLKVRDIRPHQYAAAEVRAAKAAEKARGDLVKQSEHKRNQLINLYATKAAYAAQEEVRRAITYFKKFDSASQTLDSEYRQQIEQLLESVDLRPASLKAIDKRKTLAEWAQKQEEMGLPADIPEGLLLEANRKSIKDMTVEEVRGLRETIQQIEHLGRLKHKLLTAKDKREFALIVAEAGDSIRANGGKERETQLEEPKGIMPWLEGMAAGHRKLASLLRQMDGGKDGGPMWRILGRTMNEAGDQEAVMIEAATVRLTELYAPLLKLKGGIHGDARFIPEIRNSLTRGGRLAVALNWGNETNRQRVMMGDNWTGEQVSAILKQLTREEWQFVQGAWDFIDGYWPQIEAKQLRVSGVAPEKVAASPFQITLPGGEVMKLSGGYYPVKYDANRDDRAEKHDAAAIAKDMIGGAYTRATTRRGHTKARVQEVRRPVKKTLDVITQHVSEVVHDLSWHEWLIDANRLIDAKPINQAIRDHYGTAVVRTLKDALQAIATADVVPQTKIDQALLHLRANISRSTMGFSITTALMQPFGLTQSMVRIGPKHVLQGLKRWGGDAARLESSLGWIQGKSDFMCLRSKTFNRELHEIRGRVSHGHSKARQVYDASLFMLMQKMQLVADIPTWIGGYEKALASGQDEATAVAMADQGVLDAQGSGQTKDMAELQRKHPMLGMFYSYFNVTYNLAAESTAKTDFKNPLALAGWVSDMALLMVIPALAPAILIELLRGGGDDDAEKWAKKLLEWQASYLLGTVMGLRETSGLVAGFDYSGPPVGRVVGDLGKLGKQVAQGEVDEGLALAALRLLGSATGIPTVQLIRSWRGWQAWEDGDAPVTGVLLGPPPKD